MTVDRCGLTRAKHIQDLFLQSWTTFCHILFCKFILLLCLIWSTFHDGNNQKAMLSCKILFY